MFEKKISMKQVDEIADKMKAELDAEQARVIAEREASNVERDIESLYAYELALQHSRMNITAFRNKIAIAINH